jgi:hypothetical protein
MTTSLAARSVYTRAHRVEIRDADVLKVFADRFEQQVARCRTLHRLLDGAALPSGWRARVPALTRVDPDTSSVIMTRAPGLTIDQALTARQAVPWLPIGEALGRLHCRALAEGAVNHGDLAIYNIMFCPVAREVWVIDPGMEATRNPWHDLLWLQWPIFRRGLGLSAAAAAFRGWRRTSGMAERTAGLDEGWAVVRRVHLATRPAPLWVKLPAFFVFRYIWVPLALWRSRWP